jgi:hypothetical protein
MPSQIFLIQLVGLTGKKIRDLGAAILEGLQRQGRKILFIKLSRCIVLTPHIPAGLRRAVVFECQRTVTEGGRICWCVRWDGISNPLFSDCLLSLSSSCLEQGLVDDRALLLLNVAYVASHTDERQPAACTLQVLLCRMILLEVSLTFTY